MEAFLDTMQNSRRRLARAVILFCLYACTFPVHGNAIHVYPVAQNGMFKTVITGNELARRGFLSLADVVRYLSMNPVVSDAFTTSDGQANADLRGLGTSATRVLLNGQPLPFSALDQIDGAATDLRMLPITAIERIEILPASNGVESGSGSIGGTLNIVLLENFNEVAGELWQSITEDGGAETLLSFRNGRRINNRSYDYTVAWYHRDAIAAAERDFAATADLRGRGGTDRRSQFSSPPTILDATRTPPSFADPACPADRVSDVSFGPGCVMNLNPLLDLSADDERLNLALGGDWSFENDVRFELDLAFTDGKSVQRQAPAAIFGATSATRFVFYRPLDTGTPTTVVKDRAAHVSAISSGKLNKWRWRAGLGYGRSTASRTHFNGILLDRFLDALSGSGGPSGTRRYDPFGAAPENAPGLVDFLTTDWNEYGDWKEIRLFGEASRPLFGMGGGVANLTLGLESATESLRQLPSPAAINFRIAGASPVFRVDRDRDRSAAWIMTKFPFHNRWQASAGLRGDDYENTDGVTSLQLGITYQATNEVQFRAGYSQGFRAATLAESHARRAPGNTRVQRGPGNPALVPEESESFFGGVSWRSITVPGLSVTANLWKTRHTNRITLVDNPRPRPVPRTLRNNDNRLTQAAEVSARYDVELRSGKFHFEIRQSFVERLTDDRDALSVDQAETFPDFRSTYLVDFERGRHGASATLFYVSDYDLAGGTVTRSGREMVNGWHSLDLQYRFRVNSLNGGVFRVGCRNCTDEQPPFSDSNIFGFDASFHDPRGAMLYVNWEQVF